MSKLELKSKAKLAEEAFKLAAGFNLVRYRSITYIPADFETRIASEPPEIDRTIWLPLNRDKIQRLAAMQFETLFGSDAELRNFDFMVAQNSNQIDKAVVSLLVRTKDGLMELNERGELEPATGEFRPNCLVPMLNEDPAEKQRVFDVFTEWLDSEEEAESLLRHLATCLAPGWSAVKYVLLLGGGRNGKGTLLKMLQGLFGMDNISNVTRQAMSAADPTVTELNGKLLNLVFDGPADYVKDSGYEKSLIAGEPVPIRKLYESTPTIVQTNVLFVEALNNEPKTKDKSTALQKRLVRFHFPNTYALDRNFEKRMLSERALGALLSLLIDRYVREDAIAEALALTSKALELQMEHVYANSMGLQFIKHLEEQDPLGAAVLVGLPIGDLVARFRSWRLSENDLGTWAEPDVLALFNPLLNTERKSVRDGATVRKIRQITSFSLETQSFIDSLKGADDDATADLLAAVVAD